MVVGKAGGGGSGEGRAACVADSAVGVALPNRRCGAPSFRPHAPKPAVLAFLFLNHNTIKNPEKIFGGIPLNTLTARLVISLDSISHP